MVAREQELREFMLRHYLVVYAGMDSKTYVSFDKWMEECTERQVKIDNRSTDEIMADILAIQEKGKTHGTIPVIRDDTS